MPLPHRPCVPCVIPDAARHPSPWFRSRDAGGAPRLACAPAFGQGLARGVGDDDVAPGDPPGREDHDVFALGTGPRGRVRGLPRRRAASSSVTACTSPTEQDTPALAEGVVDVVGLEGDLGVVGGGQRGVLRRAEDHLAIAHLVVHRQDDRPVPEGQGHPPPPRGRPAASSTSLRRVSAIQAPRAPRPRRAADRPIRPSAPAPWSPARPPAGAGSRPGWRTAPPRPRCSRAQHRPQCYVLPGQTELRRGGPRCAAGHPPAGCGAEGIAGLLHCRRTAPSAHANQDRGRAQRGSPSYSPSPPAPGDSLVRPGFSRWSRRSEDCRGAG
ncbi:hypothetical protein SCYAM73S_07782 [Streptomyces cyaneofuscatus]